MVQIATSNTSLKEIPHCEVVIIVSINARFFNVYQNSFVFLTLNMIDRSRRTNRSAATAAAAVVVVMKGALFSSSCCCHGGYNSPDFLFMTSKPRGNVITTFFLKSKTQFFEFKKIKSGKKRDIHMSIYRQRNESRETMSQCGPSNIGFKKQTCFTYKRWTIFFRLRLCNYYYHTIMRYYIHYTVCFKLKATM